jgi:hypothetical protein
MTPVTTRPFEKGETVTEDAPLALDADEKSAAKQNTTSRRKYPGTKAVACAPRRDLPHYLRPLDAEVWGDAADWLDFGIQQRTRFELRDDYYAEQLESDNPFLLRTRAYLGIRNIIDPLRFGFEFQDSRQFGSELAEGTGEVNENELLQAFAELYFPDAVGPDHPLSFRFGRMSFDAVNRRLFARNRFRNTTNAFDGFRLRIGDEQSPWDIDIFAFQPVERFLRQIDHGDDERWIYGINGYWRGWSPAITLEPYYFVLDEDRKGFGAIDRELHTIGIHGFGLFGDSGFDYDFDFAYQFGQITGGRHRAFATHGEIGYSFDHKWKPRAAVFFDYATGERDANDDINERFNSLFGAAHNFYGHSDNFGWNNLIQAAFHLSAKPTNKLRLNAFYRNFWLASDSDAFVRAGIRDRHGNSGDWIGHEIDMRTQYQITEELEIDVGYAYFIPGSFTSNAGSNAVDDSDFFYVQLTITPHF